MGLPAGIEQEILEYLHLEYGEEPDAPSSLKPGEITYDGLYDMAGKPTHYFKYGERKWATVEPFGDSYVIGMTTRPPYPITKKNLYKSLRISFPDDTPPITIELESRGHGNYGFSRYRDVTLPDGTTIAILVEVSSHYAPAAVTLAIEEGENDIYIRGSLGLTMSYRTRNGSTIYLTVGTGPWE